MYFVASSLPREEIVRNSKGALFKLSRTSKKLETYYR